MTGVETGAVPLSHTLGTGTVGHLAKGPDTSPDISCTVDLKALARNVLARGRFRDTAPDEARTTVPGSTPGWDGCPAEWRDGFASLNHDRPALNFPLPAWRTMVLDAESFLATW